MATILDAPKSIAPMIVAADLDVPGIIDRHWINPMKKAVLKLKSLMDVILVFIFKFSTSKIIIPPMSKAIATVHGLNRLFSILLPSKAPKIIAGKTPTIVLNHIFQVSLFLFWSLVNGQSLFQKYTTTAKIAPSCITISKRVVKPLLKVINWFTRIKCPVEEIGKNSVKPSATPKIIA